MRLSGESRFPGWRDEATASIKNQPETVWRDEEEEEEEQQGGGGHLISVAPALTLMAACSGPSAISDLFQLD